MNKIIVSLDDGRSQDFEAMALLKKYELPIPLTVYISAGNILADSRRDMFYPGLEQQEIINQYEQYPCEIGAHGYYHWKLEEDCEENRLDTELMLAARELHRLFRGRYGSHYALPFGLTSENNLEKIFSSEQYKTIRFYQTRYLWVFNLPENRQSRIILPWIITRHWEDLRSILSVAGGKDVHFAGHAGDILKLSIRELEEAVKAAESCGYAFSTQSATEVDNG